MAEADGMAGTARPTWLVPYPELRAREDLASDPKGEDKKPDLARRNRWQALPSAAMAAADILDPRDYVPDHPLIDAINTAILLGQPLLVTGEPGCGKTEVANFLAWQLGLERETSGDRPEYALRFDTKSTTTARDLFYTFDTVGRFHAAQPNSAGSADPRNFISFSAVGRAILDANGPEDLGDLFGRNWTPDGRGPKRSVVLIDEIDKAPRDVPNDLLMEIERLAFYVPELDRTVQAPPAFRPIVILTSNSERALPDAFLRRCVFFAMPFPEGKRLRTIVENRIRRFPVDSPIVGDAIALFLELRKEGPHKKPGTAELLGFLIALRDLGFDQAKGLDSQLGWQRYARVTLLKTVEDQQNLGDGDLDQALRRARR